MKDLVIKRVHTGVKGMDELIQGGIPEGSPILISGSPGTGKTIFGLQFLHYGAINNASGIYITFEEPKSSIIVSAENFGWDLSGLEEKNKFRVMEYFELGNEEYLREINKLRKSMREAEKKRAGLKAKSDLIEELEIKMADYQDRIRQIEGIISERRYTLTQREREQEFMEKLNELVSEINAKRLVIDSLSAYTIYDESRESLHRFIRKIRDVGTTSLLISELPKDSKWLSRDKISEFACDGVIILSLKRTKDMAYGTIRLEKMRSTRIDRRERFIWFTKEGLEVSDEPQEY
ncbi:MAG: ATPase domain-containing protein [Candidatus Altiarchaeota archaeon]|nr:ATPase domain-containing protein [Candidatus Altiarchaeota archaeon]